MRISKILIFILIEIFIFQIILLYDNLKNFWGYLMTVPIVYETF